MIKAIFLDFYGTIAAYNQNGIGIDFNCPPPEGLRELFDYSIIKNIRVISTSDEMVEKLKKDMSNLFSRHLCSKLTILDYFDFIQLDEWPKDFSKPTLSLGVKPYETLVIGDGSKDALGAKKYGCNFFRVPEYRAGVNYDFNFRNINIEEFNLEEIDYHKDRTDEV